MLASFGTTTEEARSQNGEAETRTFTAAWVPSMVDLGMALLTRRVWQVNGTDGRLWERPRPRAAPARQSALGALAFEGEIYSGVSFPCTPGL